MTPNEACHCPRVKHMHGTRNNYLAHACRCQPCTNDATAKRDRHRRLQAYGRPHPHKVDATQARNTARRNGWLPPLAWDEDNIDNPSHHGYPKDIAA